MNLAIGPRRLVEVALLIVTLAGCAGSPSSASSPAPAANPGPSLTPPPATPPPVTPAPATPAPATPAPATPSPTVSPLTGPVVEISADGHRFDQATVSAPADQPFHIVFANNELLTPHNVEIRDAAGTSMFFGKVFEGEATMTYDVPALPAATYEFRCSVHPEMTGSLVAG